MTPGTPVRILIGAGCVRRGTAGTSTRFVGVVEPGQAGLYHGPCPGPLQGEDWHVIAVGNYDVPLHSSHFEGIA